MKKKIISFERNEVFEEFILSKIDAEIYYLEEKSSDNKLINKILRFCLYLKLFYLLYFVKIDLIISTVYNSHLISKLISIFPKKIFIIIQHYISLEFELKRLKKLNLGIFLCFGDRQKNSFLKFNHNIDQCKTVGSLIYSAYRKSNVKIKNPKIKICYISQWTPSNLKSLKGHKFINENYNRENDIETMIEIEKNLLRYLKKYNYDYKIALREKEKSEEFDYFKSIFDEKNLNIRKNSFDTYKLMDNSEVVITWSSTCGYEIFADNKKVLFIPYQNKEFKIFQNETCVLEEKNFEAFEKKLNNIINMSNESYENLTLKDQNSIIDKFNLKSTDSLITEQINRHL
jgi:surface carbohydrate biosynthesis protein|tara:strand:- start:2 stop:1033 length:1032 start_codon:yes stop_codon:yes gene_type:complete